MPGVGDAPLPFQCAQVIPFYSCPMISLLSPFNFERLSYKRDWNVAGLVWPERKYVQGSRSDPYRVLSGLLSLCML